MGASTETDFRARHEGKEERMKVDFLSYLTGKKRPGVDGVPLPGGILFLSHPSLRKIMEKKEGSILAWQNKALCCSVFNLEEKTECQIGVGSFVGHSNKLFLQQKRFLRGTVAWRNASMPPWQPKSPGGVVMMVVCTEQSKGLERRLNDLDVEHKCHILVGKAGLKS